MSAPFEELVDRAANHAGLNDYQLSAAIGLLPGQRVFSAKQVARLRRGEQRHVDRDLVQRLIDVLHLDWAEAWAASGLLPTHVTAEDLRTLELFRQRPLEPVLTHARGGQQPPTAFSLRTTRSTKNDGDAVMGTLIVLAARRGRQPETGPVAA